MRNNMQTPNRQWLSPTWLLVPLLLVACCGTANAGFVLTLDDLNTAGIDVIVVDNNTDNTATTSLGTANTADSNATVGAMTYSGSVGAFWLNVTTGVSKPAAAVPGQIRITSLNLSSATGGSLVIQLTDTDFYDPPLGPDVGLLSEITTTNTGATITAQAILDPGNYEFGVGSNATVISHAPLTPTNIADSIQSAIVQTGAPYSLTSIVQIDTVGAADVGLTHQVTVVPEPASLTVFGLGAVTLFGFVGLRRRQAGVSC